MWFGTGIMVRLSVVFFHRPGAPPLGGVSIQQSHLSAIKLVVFKTSTLNKSLPRLQWTCVRVWLSCDFIETSILIVCLSVLVIQLVITLPLQYLQQYLPSLGRQSSCSHAVWLHPLPLCTPPACLPPCFSFWNSFGTVRYGLTPDWNSPGSFGLPSFHVIPCLQRVSH